MLSMSQNRDPAPSAEKFGRDAIRCGRILERSSSVSYCCRAWQSSSKHFQMPQYWLIKQVCSRVKFFTPWWFDFICHAYLIDWKTLNSNCGEIFKGKDVHHSYINNLILREKRLKKKIKIEQDLKLWPLQYRYSTESIELQTNWELVRFEILVAAEATCTSVNRVVKCNSYLLEV